jgi:esterase/lipase
VINPYNYTPVPSFNLQLKETNSKWLRYAVDFPVAVPTSYQEHNTALGEYYRPPDGDNLPLAILVHGWGDRSLAPCRMFARDLIKIGFACFILRTVFHSDRMAKAIKSRLPRLTPEEWFEGYRTSVIDVRQIIDWAGSNGQVDKNRIAVIGVSLGGIISSISMALDKRIQAGVILVAGGNYENPAWLKRTGVRRSEAEYIEGQRLYRDYLDKVAREGLENVEPPRKSFLTDPVTFAGSLHHRPVLMVNATLDETIPKQSTIDLWEASGKPELKWIPGTHSSVWLLYPMIRKQVLGFLTSTFKMP